MEAAAPIALHARSEGNGPAILLLHGLGGDHTIWNAVIPRLAERARVVAPDLRGHGRSPMPSGSTLSFEEMEADLLRLVDDQGLGASHLVGASAGGFLATRAALDHPERFHSLTLIGSGAFCDRHSRSVAARWAETFQTSGADGLALRLLKDLYYPDWIEAHLDYADELRVRMSAGRMQGAVLWGQSIATFDERMRMPKIGLPLLAIHGMDDHVVDVTHARLLRQMVQGAEVRLLAQTGHLVPVERPSETAQAIADFVARSASAGGGAGERPRPAAP